MATETGRNTRTIQGFVAELLDYPRWLISREVDFSGCCAGGHYNEFLSVCVECRFGDGCRWLDRHRTVSTARASLGELIEALKGAVDYVEFADGCETRNSAEARVWLRDARRFLNSQRR